MIGAWIVYLVLSRFYLARVFRAQGASQHSRSLRSKQPGRRKRYENRSAFPFPLTRGSSLRVFLSALTRRVFRIALRDGGYLFLRVHFTMAGSYREKETPSLLCESSCLHSRAMGKVVSSDAISFSPFFFSFFVAKRYSFLPVQCVLFFCLEYRLIFLKSSCPAFVPTPVSAADKRKQLKSEGKCLRRNNG